jgi:hypothetical protein
VPFVFVFVFIIFEFIEFEFISGLVAPRAIHAASGEQNPVFISDLSESCDNSTRGGRKDNGQFCQSGGCVTTSTGDAFCRTLTTGICGNYRDFYIF